MPTITEEREAAALALPRAERARLIRQLIESLDEDEGIEEAWEEEVRRRLQAYHAGPIEAEDASDVLGEARSLLGQ
jgi:putative addiction module component (TIGR02574 family)